MSLQTEYYPDQSPLISPELEQKLIQILAQLTRPVTTLCLVENSQKSREMAVFLKHIAKLSPQLSCAFCQPGEDRALDKTLNASLLPATGIYSGGAFGRMVFHGVPGGQEFTSFAAALLNAGGGAKPLDRPTQRAIERIKRPIELQVCISLGCHHCAQTVIHAQRIAWENPMVIAHMVDANLYPAFVAQHQIQRVPLTIFNQDKTILGGKTIAELTALLAKMCT